MNTQIERRLKRLEEAEPPYLPPLLIIRQVVNPNDPDAVPTGIHASPPHIPRMDRGADEPWKAFVARVEERIAHLPSGAVVSVITRSEEDART